MRFYIENLMESMTITKGVILKYINNVQKDGYTTFNYQTKKNYRNSILRFHSILDAFSYIYYAKDNVFEIEINNILIRHSKLLKTLIRHEADIRLVTMPVGRRQYIYYVYFTILIWFWKLTLKKNEYCPIIYKHEIDNNILYTLDGYVVNDVNWDYYGRKCYGIYDLSNLPFKYQVIDSDEKVEFVEKEYQLNTNVETIKYSIYNDTIGYKAKFIPCAYVYSLKNLDEEVELSIFLQGYEYVKHSFEIETDQSYQLLENDDWKYYSKKSKYFKQNFIKIKFDNKDLKLAFKYQNRYAKLYFTRDLQSKKIFDNLYIENNVYNLIISPDIEQYKSAEYKYYEQLKKDNTSEIYLFSDRKDKADDNAEALYRYYKEHTNKDIYFALDENCQCWNRLKKQGFNLIPFGSKEHKEKYVMASKVISSHAARRIYGPFYPNREFINLETADFVFLQHGIIMGKHHGFLDRVNNKLDLVITSTDEEAKIVKEFSGYENIKTTGLARFDNYAKEGNAKEKFIVYAPSWNVKYKANLNQSTYKKEIEKVLQSRRINSVLKDSNMTLYLIFHPEFIKEQIHLTNPFDYKILKHEEFLYSEVLNNCQGLITDYSSLFFDVLYQEKFVIQHKPYELHHDNDELISYFKAIYESFTIEQLESIVEKIKLNNYQLEEEKLQAIHEFYKFKDDKFCYRNYQAIEGL